ncbi:MAG: TonB-dependent receptor [Microscillaceae bacterium]|nr:TonB-dependent receptor [Microscillaceae bacterium]
MKIIYLPLLFCLLICFRVQAQHTLSGKVTDANNEVLVGASILEVGTTNGTLTDETGAFKISLQSSNATIKISFVGYQSQEISLTGQTELNIILEDGASLGEIQVVGSRAFGRSSTETPVAVDVIEIEKVAAASGQIDINQLLHYAAPSFNANKQSGSDGADHIVPATLRGLGPDQTLVLINGKRRHSSSLVNVFGTRGRGNTGTDLNAIPVSAIERIEILRDGAAAQYGSDAIAGVINIVLKKNTGEFTGSVLTGAYNTQAKGDFPEGTANTDGFRLSSTRDGNALEDDRSLDGGTVKVTGNYGVGIGKEGFVNVTSEFFSKNKTLRPGFDFRRGFGEAAVDQFNLFANAAIPLGDKSEFYAFGGSSYRDTDAFAFTRDNNTPRTVLSIFPNGFTPRITSVILDNSLSAGVRTQTASGWNIDLNNTYGVNKFHYFIQGTVNASLEEASPLDFDAGGHRLSQNTSGLYFSKFYKNSLEGINVAFGAEYRIENFRIFAGDEASWATYDVNGVLITDPSTQIIPTDPATGELRPGGSQGFPGYSPANEVDRSRSNLALYLDTEFEFTKKFLVSAAARFEQYSDFGNTLNVKLASRLKVTEDFILRGSVSTGFRAPSLVQIYYNLRFTDFQGGIAEETLLSPNNSPITKSFGIQPLKEETALNAALGFTYNIGGFTATIDGYFIDVKDRVVLSGYFDASALGINVVNAQFFANGADTRTLGLDMVLAYNQPIGKGNLNLAFIGNINDMSIEAVNNGNLDAETFFGVREQGFLLASAPKSKLAFSATYSQEKISARVGLTRFSEIELYDFDNNIDLYEAKITTDLSLTYNFTKKVNLTLGANNLLNVYPDQQDDLTEGGGYWDAVQMGFSGAYYFARLGFGF